MAAAEDPGDSTFDWDEAVEVSSRKDGFNHTIAILFNLPCPWLHLPITPIVHATLHQCALHMHIPQSLLRHAKPRSANASPQYF